MIYAELFTKLLEYFTQKNCTWVCIYGFLGLHNSPCIVSKIQLLYPSWVGVKILRPAMLRNDRWRLVNFSCLVLHSGKGPQNLMLLRSLRLFLVIFLPGFLLNKHFKISPARIHSSHNLTWSMTSLWIVGHK